MIDPGHTRDTTRLETKDPERGETAEGETEIRVSLGWGALEALGVKPENNRTEMEATATVEKTAGMTGGKKTRARAGVEGILARNKFFSLTLLSLQFIEYPTNHILIYVITKT